MIKEFFELLSEEYPEKVVYLLGMEYTIDELTYYIITSNICIHTFDPVKFKKYLDEKHACFSSKSNITINKPTMVSSPGDIMFDTITNTIKMFDGNSWIILY